MSNSVQGTSGVENVKPVAQEAVDTPMDSPGSVGKGKGKMAEEMPIDESEDSGEEEVRHAHSTRHIARCRKLWSYARPLY